jgi:hypothetical protein
MSITIDTHSLQPVAAPIAPPPPRQAAVASVGERDGTNNDRRESAKGERGRTSAAFRSFLDAATLSGLTKTLGALDSADRATETTRARKVPNRRESTELSGAESERLYQEAHTAPRSANPRASEFLAATTRYAKSFFAVSGTFAKPGESLELSA